MKLRPDAASYVVLVLVASRAADSSRDASRDARRPRTPTHTRVSSHTHDDSMCFFDESRCFFARVRVSLSHCLPTHTNTHIDSPIRKSRSRSRVRSMQSIDDIRSMTSDGMHRSMASNDCIDRWTMDAIDRDTQRRRRDGATDEDARECVCAAAPRTSTCVSPSTIETRSSRRTDRITRTNRTRARRTDRRTETIQIKDTVIVRRHWRHRRRSMCVE